MKEDIIHLSSDMNVYFVSNYFRLSSPIKFCAECKSENIKGCRRRLIIIDFIIEEFKP